MINEALSPLVDTGMSQRERSRICEVPYIKLILLPPHRCLADAI